MSAESMSSADFEVFQKFLAFQQMQAGTTSPTPTETIAAVAADVTTPATAPTTADQETARDVTVTIATAGGYGVTGTDGTLYSVGRANRETRGKIFAAYKVGDTVTVTMLGKYAAAVAFQKSDALKSAQKAIKTAAPVAAPVRKNGTTRPPCGLCGGDAHPHEGMAFLVCLSRQYTRETGQQVRMAPGYGAEFVAFAAWFARAERTAYAANTAGQKQYGGTVAAPAVAAPAVAVPVTVSKASQTPVAASETPAKQARGHCTVCRRFVKAGATVHDTCAQPSTAPAVDAAVVAAMATETVHIDALDAPVVQETAPAVKAPDARSQTDINAMSGVFDVTLDGFKKDRDAARAMDLPIIRLKSAEFVTKAGDGRWFKMAPALYAKLDTKPVGFAFRIELQPNCIVSKIGRIPSDQPAAPVETNPQGTVSATAQKRAATRRARTGAKHAPIKQTVTQTNVPTAAEMCQCGRRFNTAGRGQRGLCAVCAPKASTKAS